MMSVLETALIGILMLAVAKVIRVAAHTPWLNSEPAKTCVGCGCPVGVGAATCPGCGASQQCGA